MASIKGNEFIFQTLAKIDLNGYWKKPIAGSTFEFVNSGAISGVEIVPSQDIDK